MKRNARVNGRCDFFGGVPVLRIDLPRSDQPMSPTPSAPGALAGPAEDNLDPADAQLPRWQHAPLQRFRCEDCVAKIRPLPEFWLRRAAVLPATTKAATCVCLYRPLASDDFIAPKTIVAASGRDVGRFPEERVALGIPTTVKAADPPHAERRRKEIRVATALASELFRASPRC